MASESPPPLTLLKEKRGLLLLRVGLARLPHRILPLSLYSLCGTLHWVLPISPDPSVPCPYQSVRLATTAEWRLSALWHLLNNRPKELWVTQSSSCADFHSLLSLLAYSPYCLEKSVRPNKRIKTSADPWDPQGPKESFLRGHSY